MSKEWYYQVMDEAVGPVSSADLVELARHAAIDPDTPVRLSGKLDWMPAERIKGLFPKPAPVPPPVEKPVEQAPADSGTYHISGTDGEHRAPREEPYAAVPVASAADQADGDFEFFDFVGFDEAISHALHEELVRHAVENKVSITQVTRQALAEFLGKPELANPEDAGGADKSAPQSEAAAAGSDGSQPNV